MKWRETKKKSSKITFLYHKESRWFKNDSARILLYFWLFYVSPIDIFCVVNVMLHYLPSPTASNKNPCKCLLQNAILNRILIVKLYFRIRETLHAKLCNSLNEFVCNGNAENDVRVCVWRCRACHGGYSKHLARMNTWKGKGLCLFIVRTYKILSCKYGFAI